MKLIRPLLVRPVTGSLTESGKGIMANTFQTLKTHCPHGHEYTPENTKLINSTKPGHFKRQCRTCKKLTAQRLAREAKQRKEKAFAQQFASTQVTVSS